MEIKRQLIDNPAIEYRPRDVRLIKSVIKARKKARGRRKGGGEMAKGLADILLPAGK